MKPAALLSALLLLGTPCQGAPARDLNTPRTFPPIESREDWKDRSAQIRNQALASCGLIPMPPKSPLNAQVFGKVERDGYTIEKVYFETYPGFFLSGNLYRPLGKGDGPFPGILNPHGHWKEGRMADVETGSIAARCIHFAREGMVAFSYDMVGYNDTRQVDHKFASDPANQLWNICLMGLQTWNSIRALDFLEGLPDVDPKRLACTGESGGGTQTFMLGAIDERLAVQAPIVMVSHTMQGGCLCENAPGLRVEYSNMEIAAAPAPRRQVIVAATGDWTRKMMEVEGPAIRQIYSLLGAPENFQYSIFDYPHNYNKTTRQEVYRWFNEWLLGGEGSEGEREYKKEADADLLVVPDGKLPSNALDEAGFIASLKALFERQLETLKPRDERSLARYREVMEPLWNNSLQLPAGARTVSPNVAVNRAGRTFLLVDSASEVPAEIASGRTRISIDWSEVAAADQFANYYTTYNRTALQEKAVKIYEAVQKIRAEHADARIVFYADAKAAPAFVFAAPLADAVVADCSRVDERTDAELLTPDLFFPGYRKMGGMQGALTLAAPRPLLIYSHAQARTDWIQPLYSNLGESGRLQISNAAVPPGVIDRWLKSQNL